MFCEIVLFSIWWTICIFRPHLFTLWPFTFIWWNMVHASWHCA